MSEPRRSVRAAVRRWWPVAVAVPLGAAAGAGYAAVAPTAYTANSYVVVVAQNPGEGATAVNFAQAYGSSRGSRRCWSRPPRRPAAPSPPCRTASGAPLRRTPR
ncbi:hypothetical protein ACFQ1I_32170 [Kitasatospora arboriphila]